jgi:hypothetical protein
VSRLGSTVARLKLKGIGGGAHKGWRLRFNSTQREEPYQGRQQNEGQVHDLTRHAERCCMAVVSSCRENLFERKGFGKGVTLSRVTNKTRAICYDGANLVSVLIWDRC